MKKYISLFLLLGTMVQSSLGMTRDEKAAAFDNYLAGNQAAFQEAIQRAQNFKLVQDMNQTIDTNTLLATAMDSGNVNNLERLFIENPNINVDTPNYNGDGSLSMLASAVSNKRIKDPLPIAAFFVKHGANVNLKNSDENTPLGLAVVSGHIPYIRFLLDNEANPLIPNQYGKTPLFFAEWVVARNATPENIAILEIVNKAAEKYR